ncbi:hypothetical protein Pan265_11680 [Mucisphaera calidilacus]|uniref:Lipid A deacylase LpxR family protein n=2 Tax=Mucisphaera calidilacus TaxID=2527982 RepID=A0A518BWG3_9BACT|nr:lipid A deacylase LpxR family protein [Mucisphaera calidilacus]QDU71319.1 hypothetical protein Pan265_11680 [Mucisphaera calidilacus]
MENDSTPLKIIDRSDRQYTNGLGLLITHQPDWADALAVHIPSLDHLDTPDDTAVGYLLAQKIFTPDNLDNPAVDPDDRRYAGYTYLGAFLQRANQHTLDHFQLDLGWIGPSSGADVVQSNWHDAINIQEPMGWGQQLPDEPTIQATFRKKWRVDLDRSPDGFQHELIPRAELILGTVQRQAAADLLWRASWLPLPRDFGPSQLDDPDAPMIGLTDHPDSFRIVSEPRWTAYFYGRAGIVLVEHDTFIEGSSTQSDTGLDAKPLVGRFQVGIEAARHTGNGTFRIGLYQTILTDQFEGQTRPHSFGGLAISYAWRF